MSNNEIRTRRALEMGYAVPEHRKVVEKMWIELHKAGVSIPPSDEVIKILAGLRGRDNSEVDLDLPDAVAYGTMITGLTFLAYVSLVKERL